MTNEAIELTRYMEEMHEGTVEWWEHTGILGLSGLGSAVATVVVFFLGLYVFGVIKRYRADKKWLLPNGRYFLEIFRGFSLWLMAVAGIPTPRENKISSDAYYEPIPVDLSSQALNKARDEMERLGITYKDAYRSRQFDCEDFATVLKGLATFYASKELPSDLKKGIPISMVAYMRRDKKGALSQSHVDIKVHTTDGDKYYQPYPEHRDQVEMDSGEEATIEWTIT